MPLIRGRRGPRRARGSNVKLSCAFRRCRCARDVKNAGADSRATKDDVDPDLCRALHRACRTVRFCGPTHRRLATARVHRRRGQREALELAQYVALTGVCLSMGAPWLVALTLLQLVAGERAECICKAQVGWIRHFDPADSDPATLSIPKVNGKTKPRDLPIAPAVASLFHTWRTQGLQGAQGSRWPFPGQNAGDPNAYLFPGLQKGGAKPSRALGRPVTVRGYRKRLRAAAEVLQRERSRRERLRSKTSISEHPFKEFPLDRLGTHSLKRSAVVLMKDNCTSTALVGAISGTTAKTLDRIYDAPTWRRQQTLAVRAFTQVASALQPAAPAAAEEGPLPAAKFCAHCGRARGEERWACCPWCGRKF